MKPLKTCKSKKNVFRVPSFSCFHATVPCCLERLKLVREKKRKSFLLNSLVLWIMSTPGVRGVFGNEQTAEASEEWSGAGEER